MPGENGLSESALFWGLLFSTVGFGFFLFGKKRSEPVPLVCGTVMMIVPFFVTDPLALVGSGGVLTAVALFVRL